MTRYRAYLVLFAVIYALCFAVALPAFIDEAYTYNLVTDASLTHMLSALAHGADGAFPAYPLFAFGWAKVLGASELSLRLTGGLFVILFVWHCGERLLRRFPPMPTAVALAFILANERFIFYTIQSRFYGLVVFLFSLMFWSTWDLLQDKAIPPRRRFSHGVACGLLCLSHPLGIVYAGILALLYAAFSTCRRTFSWWNSASFLGGPVCLLAWLPAFQLQKGINAVFSPGESIPGWTKYWEFAFLDSKVLFAIVLVGAGLLAVANRTWKRGGAAALSGGEAVSPPGDENRAGNTLLIIYAISFVLVLNATLALLDWAHVIPVYSMLAVRYVLVSAVAYAVIVAGILERLEDMVRRAGKPRWGAAAGRLVLLLMLVGLLAGMATSWSRWLLEKSSMESTLARLSKIARDQGLEIVCEDHESAFLLATRGGAANVKYVLAEDFPFKTLMRRIHDYYPQPVPVSMAQFQQITNDFVLLPAGKAPVVIHHPATPAP